MKGYPYITVTRGLSTWFAVMIWWNPEMGGFPEPYDSGVGRYIEKDDAIVEAEMWAKEEGLECVI